MELLSVEQTTERLGIPKATMAKMRWAGSGPKFVKIGRKVYYRVSDIEAWIEAQTRSSTSEKPPWQT